MTIIQKRSWSKQGEAPQTVAKPGLTPRKVMLCVLWDWKGIVHYELLPPSQTGHSPAVLILTSTINN